MNNFQIKPLQYQAFAKLFHLNAAALEQAGIIKMVVDKYPGFPCRVSLQDAAIGEQVILLPYRHHDTTSPYQSTRPVFIRHNAQAASPEINEIPVMLRHRLLSVRAYNNAGIMVGATVTEGAALQKTLTGFFDDTSIDYVHIHNAKQGCYNCVAVRALQLSR